PHTPWPLVQPPESLVPMPTKMPPAIVTRAEGGTSTASAAGWRSAKTRPPTSSPATKRTRQATSSRSRENKPERMPLTPATRPFRRRSNDAAAPMSAPPARAATTEPVDQTKDMGRCALLELDEPESL